MPLIISRFCVFSPSPSPYSLLPTPSFLSLFSFSPPFSPSSSGRTTTVGLGWLQYHCDFSQNNLHYQVCISFLFILLFSYIVSCLCCVLLLHLPKSQPYHSLPSNLYAPAAELFTVPPPLPPLLPPTSSSSLSFFLCLPFLSFPAFHSTPSPSISSLFTILSVWPRPTRYRHASSHLVHLTSTLAGIHY